MQHGFAMCSQQNRYIHIPNSLLTSAREWGTTFLTTFPPIAGKHSPLSQPFLTAEETAENPQDNTHNTKDKTQNARAETMQLF